MPRIDDGLEPAGERNGEEVAAPAAKVQLAINLFDLDRIDPFIAGMLFKDKLQNCSVRVSKERGDEVGVPFACDLLTAACICDTVRNHDRQAGDYPTRVYVRRETWSRLPGDAVLTEVFEGGLRLNPAIFKADVQVAASKLEPEAVKFGGVP